MAIANASVMAAFTPTSSVLNTLKSAKKTTVLATPITASAPNWPAASLVKKVFRYDLIKTHRLERLRAVFVSASRPTPRREQARRR